MGREFWDARYDDKTYAYGTQPNRYFKTFLDKLEPGKLLLPGEGEGRNAVYAAEKGWEVVAVDQSIAGQQKSEMLAENRGVSFEYYVGNILDYPFRPAEFDVIAMIFFHLPPDIRIHVHKQFIESLKPGGYMTVENFSKDQLGRASGGPPAIELLYDKYMMNRDFQTLDIMELYETEEDLDEGPFHQGKAALVRMIGKKNED